MSDFEDDLSDSQVSQPDPPKKQGLSLPKVSTPVLLGTTLAVLVGGVGAWWAINNANSTVAPPDPVITQTAPVTTPDSTTPTTPTTSTTSTTPDTNPAPNATTNGSGVEAGNIPLIASTPKPAATTATPATKPAAKPVVKPAPKPAAPRVLNPFAPLPQSGAAVAVINAGRQSAPVVETTFTPPATVAVVRPTPTPTIRTPPSVSLPFTPVNTRPAMSGTAGAGSTTRVAPVPIAVTAQRPVIPKVAISTPAVSAQVKPRPVVSTPIAQPSFSVRPPLLASQPRVQAPIQASTPTTNSQPTNPTTSSVPSTPSTPSITQTPTASAPTRPAVSDPPIFKIEPAPTTRPATTTAPSVPSTTPSTSNTTTTTPTTPATPATTTTPSTPAQPVVTNPTPSNPTNPSTPTTPSNPSTAPTTPTVSAPATQPSNPPSTTSSTNTATPASPTATTTPSTPTTPTAPTANTNPPATDPNATTPNASTTPAAPSADLLELRRVVQDDLRLEYAGFSIGTVKKAFFQSSRGLLSVAEGETLVRDSNIVLKSVSPTEVVLALGNEVLTLPLVKR